MAHMVPEYYDGCMWVVEGETAWPADEFTLDDVLGLTGAGDDMVEQECGWWVRLTAPGYTDASEWMGPSISKHDARTECMEAFGCDPYTGEDLPEDLTEAEYAQLQNGSATVRDLLVDRGEEDEDEAEAEGFFVIR